MDSKVTHSGFYDFVRWADAHRKQLLVGLGAIVVAGAIIGFMIYRSNARETEASEALSHLRGVQTTANSPTIIPSDDYLRIAAANPKTTASERALLLGATALFAENKFADALAQFEKFLVEYPDSPLRADASLGAAACLEAQGKIADATTRYAEVKDRFPANPAATQAKFALAQLYEQQNKPELAFRLYEELARDEAHGTLSFRSQVRAAELAQKNPALRNSTAPAPAPKLP